MIDSRRARLVAVMALWCLTLALLVAAVIFEPVGHTSGPVRVVASIGFVALMVVVPTFGALVVVHRPANVVGWLLLIAGPLWALLLTSSAAVWHLVTTGDTVPGQQAWVWIETWIGFVSFNAMLPLLILVFPTGRLLSPRWRWAVAVVTAGAVAGAVGGAFAPGPLTDFPKVDNPLGVSGWFGDLCKELRDGVTWLVFAVGVALALAGIVVRFRRAPETERLQLKWMLFAASLWSLVFPAWLISPTVGQLATMLAVIALPVATGIAVLRYRLYDIDRIISRTISYAMVTGIVVGAFVGIVALLSQLTPANSQAGIAAATLVCAAAVNPLRRQVQRVVDTRFNRAPIDAARTVDDFARGMHEEIDLEAMRLRLLSAVGQSLQPVSVSLWTRP